MPQYFVGSGKPYPNPQSAFDAIPSNLVGTGVHEVIIDAGLYTPFTAFVAWRLQKTGASSTDYVTITCADGSYHNGRYGQGVRLQNNNSLGQSVTLNINTDYTRVSNIVVLNFNNSFGNGTAIQASANCHFECVLSHTIGNYGFRIFGGGGTYYKCLALLVPQSSSAAGFQLEANNNTIVNCGAYGGANGFTSIFGVTGTTIINSWSASHSGNDFNVPSGVSASSRNNASEDSTVVGSNSIGSVTLSQMDFVNTNTSLTLVDFHLEEESILIGSGYDQSARFTTDWDLETITTWPIGPDFVYVAPPDPLASSTGATPARIRRESTTPVARNLSKSPAKYRQSKPVKPQQAVLSTGVSALAKSGKGQRSGFLSIMPESTGYTKGTVSLGTGYKHHFYNDTLSTGKEFVNVPFVSDSRTMGARVALPETPQGDFSFTPRSNDVIPVLMSHFQRTTRSRSGGTTLYEFYPNRNRASISGAAFGTSLTYGAEAITSAFTVSAFKDVEGTGYHFKSGLCDKLTLSMEAGGDLEATASYGFANVEVGTTGSARPYGGYSTLPSISANTSTINFMGLPVTGISIETNNNLEIVNNVGTSHSFQFGRFGVRGAVTVDLPKSALVQFGSMLGASSVACYGTFHTSANDRIVFDMPNCRINAYELSLGADTATIPFVAYESEDGTTPPIKYSVYTNGYSGTSFEPFTI